MDKYPLHDEKYFYKYTSAETAKVILTSKKFRYSSPLLFNDPFDVQTEIVFNFDVKSLHSEIVSEMIKLASSNKKLQYEEHSDFIKVIEQLNKLIKKNAVISELREGLEEIISDFNEKLEDTRVGYNLFWREFLKALRVFCLTTKEDSVLMWSHYAQNHSGVVFKLEVLPKEDNLLCISEPIIYQKEPLRFFAKKEWIEDVLGVKKIPLSDLYRKYAIVKSDVWKYEREWRIWTFEWEHKNQLYSEYRIFPNELNSIYFGCNTKTEDIDEIKSLAKEINENVSFYRAYRVQGEYSLRFDIF